MKAAIVVVSVVALCVVLGACGQGSTTTASTDGATGATGTSAATQHNNTVIARAQHSKGEQAQAGQAAIRAALAKKLGMKPSGDFNLNGKFSPGEVGSDCYIKTGVEAKNFSYMKDHILYGPNGTDLVFVQTSTTTPLSKCLIAVRNALGW